MRPLRLIMSAFGPYADEQVLDFSDLADRKFFLICGPTGAGKTTILDAICYALYGSTSGGMRSGDEMCSDYPSDGRETFVQLDFAVGRKYYRVRRSPAQEVKKKRGEGTRMEPAGASLAEIDANGEEINFFGDRYVTAEIEKLLGFQADQFRQVVLLPQGDFRHLLLASSDERQGIMKQLFHTELCARLENRLGEESNGLHRAYEDICLRMESRLQSCGAETEEELLKKRSGVEQEAKTAEADKKAAGKDYETYRKIYDGARELWIHGKNLKKTENEKKRLAGEKQDMDLLGKEIEKAQRAGRLHPEFTHLEEICGKGKRTRAELTQTETAGKQAEARRMQAEKDWTAVEKDEEMYRRETRRKATLEQLLPIAETYGKVRAEAEAAGKTLQDAVKEQEKRERTIQKTAKEERTARLAASGIREIYLHGQAAVLAAELRDGSPCPVCGASIHPHPAVSDEKIPTDKEVKEAQERADRAGKTAEEARKRAEEFRNRVWDPAQKQQASLQASLLEKEKLLEEQYRIPGRLEKAIAEAGKNTEEYERRRERVRKVLDAEMKQETVLTQTAKTLEKNLQDLQEEYRSKARELDDKTKAEGFADRADCETHLKETAVIRKMEETYSSWQAAVLAAEQTVQAETVFMAGRAVPDMEEHEKMLKEKKTVSDAAIQTCGRISEQLKMLQAAASDVEKWQAQQKKTECSFQLAKDLYDTARGEGTGVNFERFVLGALLDEVTEAANQRLQEMSRRRYLLNRAEGRSDGRKHAGLDLEVLDNYTGVSRPAATLSGGETFLASLSLALGLADVVQAYAGGIHLDTMFIDEGFGTLDQETLDFALKALLELQKGGRLVGIISHVPELAERIDAQLVVTRTERGSHAAFHLG